MSGNLYADGFENELSRSIRDLSYSIKADIDRDSYNVRPFARDERSVETIVNKLADLFVDDSERPCLRVSKESDLMVLQQAFPGVANYLIESYNGGSIESDNNQYLIGEQLLAEQIRRIEEENRTNTILNKWSHLLYEGIGDRVNHASSNHSSHQYVNIDQVNHNSNCNNDCPNSNSRSFSRIIPTCSFSDVRPLVNSTLLESSPLSKQNKRVTPFYHKTPVTHSRPDTKTVNFSKDSLIYEVKDMRHIDEETQTYDNIEKTYDYKESTRDQNYMDEYISESELNRLEEELDELYEKYQYELNRLNDQDMTGRRRLTAIYERDEEFDCDHQQVYSRPLTQNSNYENVIIYENEASRNNVCKRKLKNIKKETNNVSNRNSTHSNTKVCKKKSSFLSSTIKTTNKSSEFLPFITEDNYESKKHKKTKSKSFDCKSCLNKICKFSKNNKNGESMPLFN